MNSELVSLRTLIKTPMLLALPALSELERAMPKAASKWDQRGRQFVLEDLAHHARFFGTAALYGNPDLLSDYVDWLKVLMSRLRFKIESLARSARILDTVSKGILQDADGQVFSEYCLLAEKALLQPDSTENVYTHDPEVSNLYARQYLSSLLEGKRGYATELVQGLADQGKSLIELYDEVFIPSQHKLGYLWHNGKISVVQEHYVTAATQAIISSLYSRLFQDASENRPLMFAACAEGELHELGIRYIADYFQASGWNTRYFGSNVPGDDLYNEIIIQKPAVIALSATLAVNIPAVESLVKKIRKQKDFEPFILLGGHAVSTSGKLWQEIGASGSSLKAPEALSLAHKFLMGKTV